MRSMTETARLHEVEPDDRFAARGGRNRRRRPVLPARVRRRKTDLGAGSNVPRAIPRAGRRKELPPPLDGEAEGRVAPQRVRRHVAGRHCAQPPSASCSPPQLTTARPIRSRRFPSCSRANEREIQ